jgi:hypothetical protein
MSDDTPNDTIPPGSGSVPTLPPTAEPWEEELAPIPRGEAQQYLAAVLDDFVAAYARLEAVAAALARQLDAEAER